MKVFHTKTSPDSPATHRKAECISEAMLLSKFPMQKIQTTLRSIAVLFGFYIGLNSYVPSSWFLDS
jgi:hypothetical protein